MKKVVLLLGLLALGSSYLFGQEIHSPAEIFKIMEESQVTYELKELEQEVLPPDRTENLNTNNVYRKFEDGQILTYTYDIDSEVEAYATKAENYFNEQKFSLAREMYLEALKIDSTYYPLMTYIGQTYGIERDLDKAMEWYHKTIELNYIDYMAHWFLADIYRMKGEPEKALDEITIAKILNRNNPRIEQSFQEIYKLNKLKPKDWAFTPQIKIDSVGVNDVSIAVKPDWMGYALVKAVWEYEPGYKQSMGVEEGSFSTIEEKECFIGLMTTFNKKKVKKHPEFKALQLAFEKEMIDEYILYEIVLPEYPFVAYQLSNDFLMGIKNYVLAVRGQQK